uniref:Spore protein YkvP/CgeB glycosyl transferase-like domain-containing protein n=1 Tax=Paramoeba aestuarina TaxID=180227 RepID=A0A7S4KZQ1_9EUKA|mmetsp:Transcript_28893/g.44691  ORF Transcript_28893/g.44691 Transcript_28893/m.44691 type:complete len:209 (+) Transcript_28893:305-931(+)
MSEELKKPHTRTLDICCLHGPRWNGRPVAAQPGMGMREYIKATLKTFFSKNKQYSVQIGAVSPTGTVGRNTFNSVYISTMANCKIIVTANPKSEGDYRLMETLSSGAMVMEDDMLFPPPGLKDEFNIVFYNTSTLIPKLTYYLEHQEIAREIGKEGTKEAFTHHLPPHLISRVLTTVANSLANQPPPDTAVLIEPNTNYNLTNRYRRQ